MHEIIRVPKDYLGATLKYSYVEEILGLDGEENVDP